MKFKDEKELLALEAFMSNEMIQKNGMMVLPMKKVAELYKADEEYFIRKLKKNLDRFPPDFMFMENNSDLEKNLFFTEKGILQVGGILHNEHAIKIHMQIIHRFVKMCNQGGVSVFDLLEKRNTDDED